ncbi:MAG: hypothetical protein E7Z84_06575 [Methanosphaera stadtmanae]|nr:hypothetical protein [Methanosphaera stadtmanae]
MNENRLKIISNILAIIPILPELYHIFNGLIDKKSIIKIIYEIPYPYYIFTVIILIIYLIAYLLNRYIERKMYDGMIFGIGFNNSSYGYNNVMEIVENGLLWIIKEPTSFDSLYRNKIEVDPEPRCPECNPMKLEYEKHKWWHQWTCRNCNYKVRTWNHRDKIEDRVLKRAEFIIENNK